MLLSLLYSLDIFISILAVIFKMKCWLIEIYKANILLVYKLETAICLQEKVRKQSVELAEKLHSIHF